MNRGPQALQSFTFVVMLLATAVGMFAQERAPQPPPPPRHDADVMIFERRIGPPPGADGHFEVLPSGVRGADNTFIFIGTEMTFDRKIVKNAPYTAQATTETVQTLSDGNRIVRKNTVNVYRDSEGRTRHDQTLSSIGPWAAAGEPQQTSFINDPVSRTHYMLDPRSRIARKMMLPPLSPDKLIAPLAPPARPAQPPAAPAPPREGQPGDVQTNAAPAPMIMRAREPHMKKAMEKPQTESLGKQTIEGVEAEGTRDTITIPAGEIGNEQPIQVVSERWYSPELQTVVMSKHTDPRMGETTFRLTNINRNEPARTLFEVPSDYTIKEGPTHMRTIRRKPGEEK